MRPTPLIPAALAAASLLATALAAPVSAAPDPAAKPSTQTLAKGLLSPLRAAVAPNGTAYVSQDFMGQLLRVAPGKKPKTIFASKTPGAEVGAVSVNKGVVTFAESVTDPETGSYVSTKVKQISKKGKVSTVIDLVEYENSQNPDGEVVYGVSGLDEECAAQWPTEEVGPPTYTGIVESHPYATVTRGATTYVADAAMNAIVAVSKFDVATLAVLPPTIVPISADMASAFGIPECAIGEDYAFEPVPTDVEIGPDGDLYVSTLGGGAGEAAPVGAVYRVDRSTGAATQLFSGLMGAVGVAVAGNGDIYASQLFGGSIVKVKQGTTELLTFAQTALPAEVEISKGKVYATINAMSGLEPGTKPNGKLVRFK
jgi:hypothetical protein